MKYVVGLGNYALADDSIGLRMIGTITERGLDTDFRTFLLGDGVSELLDLFRPDTEKILLIDTMVTASGGGKAGDVFVFSANALGAISGRMTTHQMQLERVLREADLRGYPIPKLRVMGIAPFGLEPYHGLSDVLGVRFEGYVEEAVRQIRSSEW